MHEEILTELSSEDLFIKALERDQYKKEHGCVIRALESLLEAKATEDQWNRRFADLSALGVPNDQQVMKLVRNCAKNFEDEIELEKLHKKDVANVIDMLHEIESSQTPFGDSLRRYRWVFRLMSQEEIKRTLLKGDKILLLTFDHLAHLGYSKRDNRLSSLSDNSYRENLESGIYYTVFHFTSIKNSAVI